MELTVRLPSGDARVGTTGAGERNLKLIRESLSVRLTARNGTLRVSGEPEAVQQAARVVEQLAAAAVRGEPMTQRQLLDTLASASESDTAETSDSAGPLDLEGGTEPVTPRTSGQRTYLEQIERHDLTFCVGPAGTGKTYLAVAAAASMLKRGRIRKLVLARPAVEAGERLGFLPGSMREKVNPYLRPLLDALHDLLPLEQLERLMDADVVEVVPLAFMRGRTLNDALVILDEAQNTTRSQMLMFLTRLGENSKMVVTGDPSQTDLPAKEPSGLHDAVDRLHALDGVATVRLDETDIVRHPLVQRVVECYADE